MRNLKIVRKWDSKPAYNHPLFFCVGDHSTLIAIDENDERNSGRLVRVFHGKHEIEEIHRFSEQELELLHPLDKIIELIYDRVTDSLFLATSTGGFYQYSIGSEGLEELFVAPSGIVAFALSPDSRLLTVGTKDETVILFSFPDLEMLATIELRPDPKVEESEKERTTPFDITFAWRHDSRYFAINYFLRGIQRKIQVYDEFGKLYSTTEECNPVAQQGILAWQPSGGLIGTLGFLPTCPSPTNLDTNITFFELNGLKRSDFNPIEGRSQSENKFPVLDILWNCNSDVLALKKETSVEVWIRSNYVWMCKQTIYAEETAEATDTIININTIYYVSWDTEIPYRLHVIFSDGRYSTRDFIFSFSTGVSAGSALTASINGPNIYCTPFRDTCAPPPTCRFQASLSSLIQEVVVTNFWDGLLCILNTGELVFLKNCFKTLEKLTTASLSRKPPSLGDTTTTTPTVVSPKINLQTCYSWIWPNKSELSCISNGNLLTFELSSSEFLKNDEGTAAVVEGSIQFSFKSSLAVRAKSILPIFNESEIMGSSETKFLLVQKRCGAILLQELNVMPNKFLGRLPDTVHEIHYILTTSEAEEISENPLMIFGLDPLTRQLHSLYKNISLKLMNDVKSLGTFQQYLLVTTVQGSLEIIELKDLLQIFKDKVTHQQNNNSMNILSQQQQQPPLSLDNNNLSSTAAVPSYSRKVEKGSIIVNCCWNRVLEPALTLQIIPRGNIETISPRPLIISSLTVLLTKRKYNEVMIAMRRHRLDFNVLAHQLKTLASPDTMTLEDHLTAILEDTQDSHTLVLMVTELGDEHSDCVELLQEILQQKLGGDIEHVTHNVNTRIINPYLAVMAKLGLYETVLRSPLISGQDLNRDVVKSRVKFLSFYCDNPEILYESALGTYDLNLTSLVADCLNKDPKEYLPILNEYRSLDATKLKFTIDNKLRRYSKAVLSLLEHAETTNAESTKYIERYKLHQTVIKYLDGKSGSSRGEQENSLLKQIYNSYGHLFEEHKKLCEAAICYSRAGDFDKSFVCHGQAGNWTLALDLLAQNDQGLDSSQKKEYYTKLIHHLEQIKEYEAAAQVAENYLQDNEEAFKLYIKAHNWGKASLMRKLRLKELADVSNQESSHVQKYEEELFDAAKTLMDNCLSAKEEINRYTVRLAVVKKIKEQQALDPHGFEHDNFSDTESVSTTSSFRSSSVSSTLNSGKSYKSGKNTRKLKRKVFSLKEGSRFEDIAIIAHLWEICHRVQTELKPEVEAILPHLWHVSGGGDEWAIKVSETFEALIEEGDRCIKQVWATVLPQNEFLELKYSSPPASWSLTSWKKCSILSSTAATHLP